MAEPLKEKATRERFHRTKRKLLVYEMKFNGNTYSEISAATGYTLGTLRHCMQPGMGKWYKDFRVWVDEQRKILEDEARDRIRKNIDDSLTVLLKAVADFKNRPVLAVAAAKDILDRAGLKEPDKILVENPPDDKMAQIHEWLQNKKKDE